MEGRRSWAARHTRDDGEGTRLGEQCLLNLLAGLRRAPVDGSRAPHTTLLLSWLFARCAWLSTTPAAFGSGSTPVRASAN
jgi:hypothetical protein